MIHFGAIDNWFQFDNDSDQQLDSKLQPNFLEISKLSQESQDQDKYHQKNRVYKEINIQITMILIHLRTASKSKKNQL